MDWARRGAADTVVKGRRRLAPWLGGRGSGRGWGSGVDEREASLTGTLASRVGSAVDVLIEGGKDR